MTLAAGEYVLLVNFNPADATQRAAFRTKYGVGTDVRLFGPYSGKLNNDGDDLELKKPTLLPLDIIGNVLVDFVSLSKLMGESLFWTYFRANGNGEVGFAGCYPGRIQAFDPSRFTSQIAGEVRLGSVSDCVPKSYRKAAKVMARDIELAVIAAYHAVKDAGLKTKCLVDRGEAEGGGARQAPLRRSAGVRRLAIAKRAWTVKRFRAPARSGPLPSAPHAAHRRRAAGPLPRHLGGHVVRSL